jgi:cation diffusion facilitator family transporter
VETEDSRKKSIVRVSVVGIVTNGALAAFKATIGILSHSIAITLDAVNNLSDAASSAITIVGTKLAGKPADREHPYGFGRVEYLTTIVVASIVLWAGLTSLKESVDGIFSPQTPSYDTISLVIVGAAVLVKLALGRYVTAAGRRLDADALVASGKDATFDAVISASTVVAAVIFLALGVSLEAWLGAAIALIITKSGIEMLREAIDKVLGERIDADLARGIKQTTCEVEGVRGAYDLILADYGPQRLWGSIHIEVDEATDAHEIDRITREIQTSVFERHKVILHTVGVYATNTDESSQTHAIRVALDDVVSIEPHVLQVHGLYVDEELKGVTLDLVIGFEAGDRDAVRRRVVDEMHRRFPGYAFVAVLDSDVSE